MHGNELRQKYIEFFKSKDSLHLPSDSLAPNDPSLLFTAAGMVQFKPYFVGAAKPPHPRVVTAQKCLRTDDIDEVGDAVHHTFFEMMGNFSFGDYFKREAIHWAWEFLTEWLKLPQDRIWTSVYLDDDEAAGIWENEIGLPAARIVRLGEDKNYWPANAPSKGPNGPCGPCNEIFLDMTPELGTPDDTAKAIAYDSNRFVEMWNLVFMQFVRGDGGTLTPLPRPSIDTGLGLERVTAILQGAPSNYETDLFLPIIRETERLTGVNYNSSDQEDICFRTIADHIRGAVFCIGDGIMPSNAKRGYVLRRMIRRAALKARKLGFEGAFLSELAPVVVEMMKDGYPELTDRISFIRDVLRSEEEKFAKTISAGMTRLEQEILAAKTTGKLSGDVVFVLYDTYGFPVEITREVCEESGLAIDSEGFEELMNQQRERGREHNEMGSSLFVEGNPALAEVQKIAGKTEFLGYSEFSSQAKVLALVKDGSLVDAAGEGDTVQIVLDRTPFYAESGGQVADSGVITGSMGSAKVEDTQKASDIWLHTAVVESGEIRKGDVVNGTVDIERRKSIMRNHTATHLLHAALRQVLGTHVAQGGSLVTPDRLRFDFSHFQAMTAEEIRQVEETVNRNALRNFDVVAQVTSLKEAREAGAMALFGEKYGDQVRSITIGEVSMELCGGTHLRHTSELGFLKIVSESSVGAGLRRIEALTGQGALEYIRDLENTLDEAARKLQTSPNELINTIERLQAQLKQQQKMLQEAKSKSGAEEATTLAKQAVDVNGFKAICARSDAGDADAMSALADQLADKLGSAVVILGSANEGKVQFICKVTKDLLGKGLHAGNLVRDVAREAGGGGGGKPEFAKAGGKDPSRLDAALTKALELVRASVQ